MLNSCLSISAVRECVMEILEQIDAFVWGPVMIVLLLGSHIFLTFRTRFIQRKIPQAIKMSLKKTEGEGDISPFGALATALAATIGTGSVALARSSGCGSRVCSASPRSIPRCSSRSSIA